MTDLNSREASAALLDAFDRVAFRRIRQTVPRTVYGVVTGTVDTANRKCDLLLNGRTEVSPGFTYGEVEPVEGDFVRAIIDPLGDRYIDAVLSSSLTQTRPSVDVATFGAKGDGVTDDRNAIQSAVDFVGQAGGGEVFIPAGTYMIGSAIELRDGVTIRGAGRMATTIKVTHSGYGIAALGSQGSGYALTADAAIGATSIPAGANAANFGPGDLYMLRSEADALLTGHKRGELGTVLSVSGSNVIPAGRLLDTYATLSTAQINRCVPRRHVTVRDLGMYSTIWLANPLQGTNPMIFFDFTVDALVDNVWLRQNNGMGVNVRNSMQVRVANSLMEDLRDDTANGSFGYGINASFATRDLTVTNCEFRRCRHGFTTGTSSAGQTPNYGVQRGLTLSGCAASECSGAAFDSHEDSEGLTYVGCTVTGTALAGFQVRGHATVISGCVVRVASGNGIFLDGTSSETVISGCLISQVQAGGNGIQAQSNDRVTITGNMIIGNSGHGIYINAANVQGIAIEGNTIADNAGDGIRVAVNIVGSICGNVLRQNVGWGMTFDTGLSGFAAVTVLGNIFSSNTAGAYQNLSSATFLPTIWGNSGGGSVPSYPQRVLSAGVTTGSIAASSQADITVSWPTSFADSAYVPFVTLLEATADLQVRAIKSKANGSIVVTVRNNSTTTARTGTLMAMAIHD